MNERNSTNKLRALINSAGKKFTNLNKGSKILLKIGASVFLAFLLFALVLSVLFLTGILKFDGEALIIQWVILYSFRFWTMMIFGSIILDILLKR